MKDRWRVEYFDDRSTPASWKLAGSGRSRFRMIAVILIGAFDPLKRKHRLFLNMRVEADEYTSGLGQP